MLLVEKRVALVEGVQIVPGVGISSTASATLGSNAPAVGGLGLPANTFTRFAPSNLPAGVTAQQVNTALAPNFTVPTGASAAQLSQRPLAAHLGVTSLISSATRYFVNNSNVTSAMSSVVLTLPIASVSTPRFILPLTFSADCINVEVRNQIIPTTLSNAAQFCFDSTTFNNTSSTLGGINTCSLFSPEPSTAGGTPQFNIQNGFASGFINLGALKVRSVNASLNYNFELASIFGGSGDSGSFSLNANVYRLIDYISSAAGDFSDSQNSAGAFFRPKWETQLKTGKILQTFQPEQGKVGGPIVHIVQLNMR